LALTSGVLESDDREKGENWKSIKF
jgi:hypothetical protein